MEKNKYLYKEVIPVELPLNFSNDFLKFVNLQDFSNKSLKQYTIPMNFQVPKSNGRDYRTLSLPHPIAQIQMMAYLQSFKFNIMDFCSLSPFSIRSPQKLNKLNYELSDMYTKKLDFFNSLFEEKASELKINETDLKIEYISYFSYKKFNNILQFKNSILYHKSKTRYDNYMNLDIRNFFSSIYTHSLEWAITDNIKKTKNEVHDDKNLFRKMTDKVCQVINYNETNGILVGPEFSRIISEILLTRTDLQIARKLKSRGLNLYEDYVIFRFIDDYTIFFNNPSQENEKIIKDTIIEVLAQYKLQLNHEKSLVNTSLYVLEDTSIIETKVLMDELVDKFNKNFRYRQLHSIISEFIIKFTHLISHHPNKKVSIVRYSLKKLTELIPNDFNIMKSKLILDLAFFIFSYSPDYFSAQNMNNLMFNFRERINKNEDKEREFLLLFDMEYNNRLIKFFKKNMSSSKQIYELITASKYLTANLPNTFLCKQVQNKSYFILCTTANYILNEHTPFKLNKNYRIVFEKLIDALLNILEEYKYDEKRFMSAEYFYLINDFYHYPLFQKNKNSSPQTIVLQKKLKEEHTLLKKEAHKFAQNFNIQLINEINIFLGPMVSKSYYRWNLSYKFYAKTSILKSLNSYNNNGKNFVYEN